MRLAVWNRCAIDPVGGTAVFDDIAIDTDSITDSRVDRVMPILEEEQVLMCRVMLGRLKPGKLVLDVGTGSGVFAIYAAKKAGCRVIGIDISKRAIRCAKANARKNGASVIAQPRALGNGQMCFLHLPLCEFLAKHPELLQSFDVVFLNPPFNPTCPIVSPALHALAGPDGQGPFRDQIRVAPKLQKIGGYCLGYQMSYDRKPGQIQALASIRQAYRGKCRISFAHALRDSKWIAAGEFLRAQYASFLSRSGPREERTRVIVEEYIREIGSRGQNFSLIYYEIRREVSADSRPPREVKLRCLPNASWKNRIWFHRCIVDHAPPRLGR